MANSVTKTIRINAPYSKVFDFIVEPYNLPSWAIVDIDSIAPAQGHWWKARTRVGTVALRICSHPAFGVVDFDFRFADARWSIPSRLLSHAQGCEFVMTLFAPVAFSPLLFGHQVALIDQKLLSLKALMEKT
jgi:hypothetical protein